MVDVCYCKTCGMMKKVVYWKIDEKDRMIVNMECFHKPRVFQLITSKDDYINVNNKESNII
jgi:hypothetical protein